MNFRPKTREYYLAVVDGKCQWEVYTEDDGFRDCNSEARHIHHIIPTSQLLRQGKDPEYTVGLPLCEQHHVRNFGDMPFDERSSMHPDVAIKYKQYGFWKQTEQHLAAINGRSIDYSTSPFADIPLEHQEKLQRGERICTGDEFTDQHYWQKMINKSVEYNAIHGTVRPRMKGHGDGEKTKKWWQLIDGR